MSNGLPVVVQVDQLDLPQTVEVGVGSTGAPGRPGNVWVTGSGLPALPPSIMGVFEGDYYLDLDSGDVYRASSLAIWTLIGSIKGPPGPIGQSAFFFGSGLSSDSQGNVSVNYGLVAPINSPVFTGVPEGPTPPSGNSSSRLATTEFVRLITDLLAPKASPGFTGTPTAPTPTQTDNSQRLATTAFVKLEIANLLNGAPGALDTLQELASALGGDSNFAATVTNALAGKQPLNSILTALASVTNQADRLPYLNGTGAVTTPLTPAARSLLDDADVGAMRTTLGLGSWALKSSGAISDITSLQSSLDAKENSANKGIANGYASLDASGKLPVGQLPAAAVYVDPQATFQTYTPGSTNVTVADKAKTFVMAIGGAAKIFTLPPTTGGSAVSPGWFCDLLVTGTPADGSNSVYQRHYITGSANEIIRYSGVDQKIGANNRMVLMGYNEMFRLIWTGSSNLGWLVECLDRSQARASAGVSFTRIFSGAGGAPNNMATSWISFPGNNSIVGAGLFFNWSNCEADVPATGWYLARASMIATYGGGPGYIYTGLGSSTGNPGAYDYNAEYTDVAGDLKPVDLCASVYLNQGERIGAYQLGGSSAVFYYPDSGNFTVIYMGR